MNDVGARSEARQRWRVAYARDRSAASLTQRDELEAWQAAIARSALPVVLESGTRARLHVGPPLPSGMTAERELLDLFLRERMSRHDVRLALDACVPNGHRVVDLWDVWLGAPALAASVVAADWRIRLEPVTGLVEAVEGIIDAAHLPRERTRGDRTRRYDLRPLIARLVVAGTPAEPELLLRTRFDVTLGAGRPDEVVAALGDRLGGPVVARETLRERLVLADDP